MTSNLISRFLPANSTASPSIYETIQQHDENSDPSDIEERAGMALDEENLGGPYQDYELEEALATASDTQSTTQSTPFLQQLSHKAPQGFLGKPKTPRKSRKWALSSPRPIEDDRDDDDVPASLLVEGDDDDGGTQGLAPLPPIILRTTISTIMMNIFRAHRREKLEITGIRRERISQYMLYPLE
ncbi:hypothetical protein ACJ72_04626 [Emergomyces africanus]|uniref:Uncharacterized protein n=1 Tax=Emergomyces africanus TaxID=1955775 RepID=A0A1B7NW71_9EURO|nr:hypothetical protein ACJ72_04626 [Emergomyces africanus]